MMGDVPPPALSAAQHVQSMAANVGNQKLAFVLTGLSEALVGLMVYREMSHCVREQMRALDRPDQEHDHGHRRRR